MFTTHLRSLGVESARRLRLLTRVGSAFAFTFVGLGATAKAEVRYVVPVCGGETRVGFIGDSLWSVTAPPNGGDCVWRRLHQRPLREHIRVEGSPCDDDMYLVGSLWDRCGAAFSSPDYSEYKIYLYGAGGDDYLGNESHTESTLDGGAGNDMIYNLAPIDPRHPFARPSAYGGDGDDFLLIGDKVSAGGLGGDDDICLYEGRGGLVSGEQGYDTYCGDADFVSDDIEGRYCTDRCALVRGTSLG